MWKQIFQYAQIYYILTFSKISHPDKSVSYGRELTIQREKMGTCQIWKGGLVGDRAPVPSILRSCAPGTAGSPVWCASLGTGLKKYGILRSSYYFMSEGSAALFTNSSAHNFDVTSS